jgi:hypothetical protein
MFRVVTLETSASFLQHAAADMVCSDTDTFSKDNRSLKYILIQKSSLFLFLCSCCVFVLQLFCASLVIDLFCC